MVRHSLSYLVGLVRRSDVLGLLWEPVVILVLLWLFPFPWLFPLPCPLPFGGAPPFGLLVLKLGCLW